MSGAASFNPFAELGIEVEPLIREAFGGPPMYHDLSTTYTSLTRLLEFLSQRYFSGVVSIRFFDFDAHILLYRGRPYHAASFHGARPLAQEAALRKILDDTRTIEGWIAAYPLPDEMFPEEWELLDPLASPALPARDASGAPWKVDDRGDRTTAMEATRETLPEAETVPANGAPARAGQDAAWSSGTGSELGLRAADATPAKADTTAEFAPRGAEAVEENAPSEVDASPVVGADQFEDAAGPAEDHTRERAAPAADEDAGAAAATSMPGIVGSPEAWARLIEHMHARFRKIKGRALAGRLERELNDKLLPAGLRLHGGRVRGDLTQPATALPIAARHCFAVLQHLGGTGFAEKVLDSGLQEVSDSDADLFRETIGGPAPS